MTRLAAGLVVAGVLAAGAGVAADGGGPGEDPAATSTAPAAVPPPPPDVVVVVSRYEGRTAAWWAARARGWHARTRALRRSLLHRPQVVEALNLACVVYGGCQTLWRRARCESRFDPGAVNGGGRYLLSGDHAAGLLQFRPSTFRSTPFGRFSIFSPYASALAAGWMQAHGRGGEWACR